MVVVYNIGGGKGSRARALDLPRRAACAAVEC